MNSPTTQQCERWLDELAELASTGISEGEFYQRYLQYVIQATHADAGGLWRVVENGFRLVSQQGLREKGLAQNEAISSFHEYELAQVTASQITRHTSRRPLAQTDGGSVMSPTTGNDCWTFFPCLANGRVFAVLEIVRAADRLATDEATQGLLAAFGEIARDYYSVEVLQAQTADLQLWEAFAKYARAIHADLEPSLTAYTVVNECRRLLQLDRVTLVRMQSGRASIWAVSGIDQVDHRSALVRTAEDLFTVLARTGERFEYREGQGDLAPEIDDRLQPYLDASATRWMQIHPLRSDQTTKGREPIRALLCWELFSEKPMPRGRCLGTVDLEPNSVGCGSCRSTCPSTTGLVAPPIIKGPVVWSKSHRVRDGHDLTGSAHGLAHNFLRRGSRCRATPAPPTPLCTD